MKPIIPLLFASSLLIIACDPSSNNTVKVTKEEAIAVVNGTYISKKTFDTLEKDIQQRSHGQTFPKKQLLEELIQRELLVQDAESKQLAQTKEVAERINMATRSLLSQASVQNYLKSNPVTDEEIKAEYDKEAAKTSGVEYKARHILVKKEAEAKKLIVELKAGANFQALAKKHSTGPSGPQGGDLGWFVDGQMVESFSKAVIALKKGTFTQEPVKSQFGWHVILREDSRKQIPPPFDTIKEQLRPALQQKKIQTMLDTLRQQAKVEILMPVDEPEAGVSTTPENDTTKKEASDNTEKQAEEIEAVEKTTDTAIKEPPKTQETTAPYE
jgi:peptidyl-prolyl cis-trans isomerase C